jgi:phosphatidylglycerophosphate synthase
MERVERSGLALAADALTGFRFLAAGALAVMASTGAFTGVAVLMAIVWASDFADGRLARKAATPTQLGTWDIWADTAVGAGLVIGLTLGGTIPMWIGLGSLVLFGSLFLAGNLAASMLLQLTGYLPVLWVLWTERPGAWLVPFATFSVIGLLDWRRLFFINIPRFLHGIAGRFESR